MRLGIQQKVKKAAFIVINIYSMWLQLISNSKFWLWIKKQGSNNALPHATQVDQQASRI